MHDWLIIWHNWCVVITCISNILSQLQYWCVFSDKFEATSMASSVHYISVPQHCGAKTAWRWLFWCCVGGVLLLGCMPQMLWSHCLFSIWQCDCEVHLTNQHCPHYLIASITYSKGSSYYYYSSFFLIDTHVWRKHYKSVPLHPFGIVACLFCVSHWQYWLLFIIYVEFTWLFRKF